MQVAEPLAVRSLSRAAVLVTAVSLLLVLGGLLRADVIVLENGREIQGEIIRESEHAITVRFPGGTLELERKRIRRIERQSRLEYLLEEGDKRLLRGNAKEAAGAFREARELDPASERARRGHIDALSARARSLAELGRRLEARETLLSLLRDFPEETWARAELRVIDERLADFREELAGAFVLVRRGRLEEAAERLEELHGEFVDQRDDIAPALGETLRRLGDGRFSRRELAEAESAYRRALEVHPLLVDAIGPRYAQIKLALIQPLVAEGDFAAAGEAAREGLEIAPSSKPLRFYHALSLEAAGERRSAAREYLAISAVERPDDLEAAVGVLRRAAEEHLTERHAVTPSAHPNAKSVEPGDFRQLRGRHFVIHHRNELVARDVSTVAEAHFDRLYDQLGCGEPLRVPIDVFVHPTKEDYLAASGMSAWSGAAHRIGRPLSSMTQHRIDCYQDQPRLESGLLPHEIAHALLAHRLGYPESLPLWANEGFAVHSEPGYLKRHYRAVLAEEKRRQNLIPLSELLRTASYPQEERVTLFYAQCHSLVAYLIERKGLRRFVAFLAAISRPTSDIDAALWSHYRLRSLAVLERRWLETF